MKDIQNTEDIALLIDKFYAKVILDETIGHIFTKVIQFSWDKHIPVMISFWESLLFGTASYKGNPMLKHIELNRIFPLEDRHFKQWLFLWEETVNDNFNGQIAGEAITKSKYIAGLMQLKIERSQH